MAHVGYLMTIEVSADGRNWTRIWGERPVPRPEPLAERLAAFLADPCVRRLVTAALASTPGSSARFDCILVYSELCLAFYGEDVLAHLCQLDPYTVPRLHFP